MEEDLTENGQDMTETDNVGDGEEDTMGAGIRCLSGPRLEFRKARYSKRNPETRNNSTRERAYD